MNSNHLTSSEDPDVRAMLVYTWDTLLNMTFPLMTSWKTLHDSSFVSLLEITDSYVDAVLHGEYGEYEED